jgi:hypothetical protein
MTRTNLDMRDMLRARLGEDGEFKVEMILAYRSPLAEASVDRRKG